MKNWIINKWDWWIYLRSLASLQRLSKHSVGLTYLMELHLHDYNQRINNLPELRSATQYFYTSLQEHEHQRRL